MKRAVLLFISLIILLSSCTGGNIAGTGSESPNALTGSIYDMRDYGTPHAIRSQNVHLSLYRIDSRRDSLNRLSVDWYVIDSSRTDSTGHFSFGIKAVGQYSIVASYQNLKAFSGIINVNSLDSQISSISIELQRTININGWINDTSQTTYTKLKFGIIGTPFITECNSNSTFHFNEVPIGDLKFYGEILSTHNRNTQDSTVNTGYPSFSPGLIPVIIQNDTVRTSLGTLPITYKSVYNP